MKPASRKSPAKLQPEMVAKCPTMQDVADALGCSRATVSMALRGDRTIPEATRLRIQETATKLGYRTNPMVSSLMSLHRKRRPTAGLRTKIAYLNPSAPGHPSRTFASYKKMFEGARQRAREVDCELEEFDLAAPGMSPERMRGILRARGIHGVIVAPLPDAERRIDFSFKGLAAVGLGMSLIDPLIERVANDHFQSAALAVRECVALGYRRIGFVICQATSERLGHRWLGGYCTEVEQNPGLAVLAPLTPPNPQDVPGSLPAWLKRERPDVVILGNIELDAQAAVPPSVGMVLMGVDVHRPAAAGIFQNFPLIGRSVAERVITLLHTNSFDAITQPVLHLVGGVWVPGPTAPGPGKLRPVVSA
jgi:DNA-binding LacI/PurR family transcriptional regulator